jgi:hypothetical protein
MQDTQDHDHIVRSPIDDDIGRAIDDQFAGACFSTDPASPREGRQEFDLLDDQIVNGHCGAGTVRFDMIEDGVRSASAKRDQ